MTNKLADTFNEYGTPVTLFSCPGCRSTFTVCPAVEDEALDQWPGCLGEGCSTYDPERDADKLFDEGKVYRVGDRSHIKLVEADANSIPDPLLGTERSEVSSNTPPIHPKGEGQ